MRDRTSRSSGPASSFSQEDLKATKGGLSGLTYDFGAFRLDPGSHALLRDGLAIPLPPKAFDLLIVLIENRGQVMTKRELMERIWPDTIVEEANLSQTMFVLRKALGDGIDSQCIDTVPKVGYRFVASVEASPRPVPPTKPGSSYNGMAHAVDGRPAKADQHDEPPMPQTRTATVNRVLAASLGVFLVALAGALSILAWRGATGRPTASAKVEAVVTQITFQPGPELFPDLSPDGKSIVYASRSTGNWDIYLQNLAGGLPISLTGNCPEDDSEPAFSPDGTKIAFRSERLGGGIFVMGRMGESVLRVTDFGYNPAWSPAGRSIVLGTANVGDDPLSITTRPSELWRVDVDGSHRQRLGISDDAAQPSWSPHGLRIACLRAVNGQRDIWTIPLDGGATEPVTGDPAVDWSPQWSPDGRYLYFSSDRGGTMNLWRIPIDERSGKVRGPAEAITVPSSSVSKLAIAVDGRRAAFASIIKRRNIQRIRFDPVAEVLVGEPQPVTAGSQSWVEASPSPDGRLLVLMRRRPQEDVFVARADGSGLHALTNDLALDRHPQWSPDGRRVAFYSNRSGAYRVWVINRDGDNLQPMTPDGFGWMAWSPDGAKIATLDHSRGPNRVFETSRTRPDQFVDTLPNPGELGDFSLHSWSPDGRLLAGWIDRGNVEGEGIAVYAFDKRRYTRLTTFGKMPVWLSDSRRLVFEFEGRLYLVNRDTSQTRQLLAIPDERLFYPCPSPDDRTIYFSRSTVDSDIWMLNLK